MLQFYDQLKDNYLLIIVVYEDARSSWMRSFFHHTFSFSFQLRVFLIQTGLKERDDILDLIFIRMASFNQILDPWVYILFRKTLLSRLIQFIKVHLCLQRKQLDTRGQNARDFGEISRMKKDSMNDHTHDNGQREPFFSESFEDTLSQWYKTFFEENIFGSSHWYKTFFEENIFGMWSMSESISVLARYRQLTVTMVTVVPMVTSVLTTVCVQG